MPEVEPADQDNIFVCDEDDCDEHVQSYELCMLKDGREVCRGCFDSGYDRDGYPIAERELALDERVGLSRFGDLTDVDVELEFDVTADPSGTWDKPPEPIPWRDPTEDRHWLSFGGQRWVGDGSFAAREDGPRPSALRGHIPEAPGYIVRGDLADETLGNLTTGSAMPGGWPGYSTFSARMAPILKAGDVEAVRGNIGAFKVTNGGEVIAIVMGMRDNAGDVDIHGEPIARTP